MIAKMVNRKDEYTMKKKEIIIIKPIVTVGDLRKMDIPDDVEIKINPVYAKPVSCTGFYHEKDNKVYLTPNVN